MAKKYGRTFHLPSSPGIGSDDKVISDLSVLESSPEVVITEKMDGENTTIVSGGCHPRSPDARYHPSRDWMKAFASGVSTALGSKERIVGEYLYAKHAIFYDALPSYFLGFAWIVDGVFQDWPRTKARFSELGICSVPVLYSGEFSDTALGTIIAGMNFEEQEGFVVRTAAAFKEDEMSNHLVKYVRPNHVQSEVHWMNAEIVKNKLL